METVVLTCYAARALSCHSKDNKCQVWHKLRPAAEGDPPRGNDFISRENLFAGAKIFPRGVSVVHLNCSFARQLCCILRTISPKHRTNWGSQRRETLLGSVNFSSHFFVQAQKSREGWRRLFLTCYAVHERVGARQISPAPP